MQPVTDPVGTAERYRRFAEVEAAGMSPSYERLARAVAGDRHLLELLDRVEPAQRQPNLLFGAIRLHGVATDDPAAALRWVADHPDEVLHVLRTRHTQTNEAARCALLLPVLAQVAAGRPVALVELGASAGLCLLYDRYRYRYTSGDTSEGTGVPDRVLGGASPVELVCEADRHVPVPETVPEIVWRAGIDRNPLDAADHEDARWLRCLVWPEHLDRSERLSAALRLAAADPPRVVRAGFVEGLADLLAEVPRGAVPVVTHSAALVYAPADVREEVRRTCRDHGAWRVGAEGQRVLEGLVPPPHVGDVTEPGDVTDFLVTAGSPSGTDTVLALAQPHGRRLRWVAQPGPE